jgi:hypothetical protein
MLMTAVTGPQDPTTESTDQQNTVVAPASAGTTTRRWISRAATVVGAVALTTVSFLIARAAGADFTITDPAENAVPYTFQPADIAVVTTFISVLGWVTLAALERWTRQPRKIWSILAVIVVLLSFVPIWVERATTETRIGLVVVHLAVAVGLLPLLRRRQS